MPYFILALLALLPSIAFSVDSIYCPQNSMYIKVGMSDADVIAACGQPLSKQNASKPATQKIPVTQLMFNAEGSKKAFYGVWSLPVGNESGVTLQINVINNKVDSILMNGNTSNSVSVCNNVPLQQGDPVSKVYSACGTPSIVNNTYVNQVIQSDTPPQIWTYKTDPYQPAFSLTFVDGQLQSISN